MTSTYSPNLKLTLMGTGDQSGTWGDTTNTNLGTLVEEAIAGYTTQALAGAGPTALTIPDGTTSVGRNYVIEFTGTPTAGHTVTVPAVDKPYILFNNTNIALIVKVSGQTGFTIAVGKKAIAYTNSTDLIEVANAPVTEAGTQTLTNKTLTSPTIATPTITTSATVPLVIGGTAVSSALTLQSTSGVGTSDSIAFKVGNNGATTAMTANTSGNIEFRAGTAALPAITTTGDTNTGIFFPAADTIAFAEGGVEAMRIASDGNVSFGGTAAMSSSFLRNRIINGDMRIDQRNAGASVNSPSSAATVYTVDRWEGRGDTEGIFSMQQNSSAPDGFVNSLKITVTTIDSSLGAAQLYNLSQKIEGTNISDLGFGTANATTVTVSFWVRSSVTGTFGAAVRNSGSTRSYPFTYTISVADTWEKKTVTIAGDTSGTWLTTNGIGISLGFSFGAGTDRSGTANAWVTANNPSVTGATNLMATLNATWYVTGVQLEVGTVATPFERQIYSNQFAQCQRYYQQYGSGNGAIFRGLPQSATSGATFAWMPFAVAMRAAPTMTVGTPFYSNMSGAVWGNITVDGAEIAITITGTNSYAFIFWTASSEL